ncbi:putative phosphoinositide-specific phospholipase C [Aspergillus fischeri NRRL 181]|uniref:Phosphoinositide phospholipase C n=1 Tax=Neosartorya fischeri (strain ATCC 1020 / DSM 3700 / CBS 544.65 / FGSC A1164 / JCM 1740 / NRRL 181 / WB 181) TaxID=331117 RepID=A1D7Q8_NEOFI|nr:phosphoinositide-specific phospholipase C, putative [Aspergillus fischeri NRRL 181]EAW21752.1 phosphoinositide-specific phospholipase C, putative [Aspergillus fischeri NRRL 181]
METMEELTGRAATISLESAKPARSIQAQPGPLSSHLDKIYASLTSTSTADFIKDVQKEEIAGSVEAGNPLASLAAFRAYMASPASDALCPAKGEDLSAPITDYYVSSSHNTYLTGNQLYSDAAAAAYTNVLLSGCRCVEIDVWDGDADDDSVSGDDTSSSSSSESNSDEENPSRRKKQDVPKTDGSTQSTKAASRRKGLSSKLGSLLGRKSSPPNGATDKPASTATAAAVDAAQTLRRPEPRVLHGHTLTKGTKFRDVCYAIRDSAFVASDLPVIVSLEVHTCIEQQATMVEIMEEAFKGMLIEVTPELEATQAPPPLESLKRKILIKVKWVPATGDGQAEAQKDDQTDTLDTPPSVNQEGQPAPAKPSKVLHSLSRLAVFTKGFSFRQFTQPEAKVPGHVFSLSESAAREAYAKDRDALLEHNRHFFMRVYPYGLRVNSSNPDPTFFWRCGAQIVALNWQNLDKGMMLNRGMFTGEPGWVLKPQGYRSSDPPSTPVKRQQLDLSIEILAGQNLPLPPGDTKESGFRPYVSCYLHVECPDEENGFPPGGDNTTDSEKTSYKRSIKSATGRNPDFGAQMIQFPTLQGVIEELTFVRFKVKDDELGRDSLAAWACLKLSRLQQGYRLIHLHDCSGAEAGAVLLVRITKVLS